MWRTAPARRGAGAIVVAWALVVAVGCDSSGVAPGSQPDGMSADAQLGQDAEAGALGDAAADAPRADGTPAADGGGLDAGADGSTLGRSGKVRVVHTALGAGPLSLAVDGAVLGATVEFAQATAYAELEAGSHILTVRPAGGGAALLTTPLAVVDGQAFTVFVTNAGATDLGTLAAVVVQDPLTPPSAGNASLRFAHMAPDGNQMRLVSDGTTWFGGVRFQQVTGLKTVASGVIPLEVWDDGAPVDLPAQPFNVTLESGKMYTLVLVGHIDVGEPRPSVHLILNDP